MKQGRERWILALGLGALGLGTMALGLSPAQGQSALGSGFANHDTNAPIDFSMERGEIDDRAHRGYLIGNVIVRQGNLTLNAPRMTVAYTGAGNNQVRRIDATGGVTVTSPTETIRGATAIYDTDAKLITLLGNVQLRNRDGNINGGRLVVDLRSGRAVMDGGTPGARGSASGTTGRVTGRFTVPQRSGSNWARR